MERIKKHTAYSRRHSLDETTNDTDIEQGVYLDGADHSLDDETTNNTDPEQGETSNHSPD